VEELASFQSEEETTDNQSFEAGGAPTTRRKGSMSTGYSEGSKVTCPLKARIVEPEEMVISGNGLVNTLAQQQIRTQH
jgi:hypothetical protein